MIWNGTSSEERLLHWKNLRSNLAGKELSHQLTEIAKFYAATPFGARSLDYYDSRNWPTPWEILFHGSFCTSSISLLIYYTVALVAPNHRVELFLVDDSGNIFLLPVVDDRYILNYELSIVNKKEDICKDIKILKIFNQDQIKSIK